MSRVEQARLTEADVRYIRERFVTLEELCVERGVDPAAVRAAMRAERLPQPAYVLEDGTEMVAADYFGLLDAAGSEDRLPAYFHDRFVEAARSLGRPDLVASAEDEWQDYLTGLYATCLRQVSVENIVRKSILTEAISSLLDDPAPDDPDWRTALRRDVDALDAMEREFSPDHDRRSAPSRVTLVEEPRAAYPEVFAEHP
jgi:hypothetical protein